MRIRFILVIPPMKKSYPQPLTLLNLCPHRKYPFINEKNLQVIGFERTVIAMFLQQTVNERI